MKNVCEKPTKRAGVRLNASGFGMPGPGKCTSGVIGFAEVIIRAVRARVPASRIVFRCTGTTNEMKPCRYPETPRGRMHLRLVQENTGSWTKLRCCFSGHGMRGGAVISTNISRPWPNSTTSFHILPVRKKKC